jgi:pimeloyl-ACP methyl ester carboxylesterase
MPVIDHATPASGATYGATNKRAAAFVAAAHAPRQGALAFLWVRAAAGALAALAVGGGLFALAALAVFLLAPWPLLPTYLAAELLFAAHFFERLARLGRVPETHAPAAAAADGARAFERFLEAAAHMPPGTVEALIARWCRALPGYGATSAAKGLSRADSCALLGGLTRGNAAEMLAYGFFYRGAGSGKKGGAAAEAGGGHDGEPDGGASGEAMVRRLERAWGREFAPGAANPSLKLMAHLREPVRAHWRPAAFYLATEVVALAKDWAMRAAGWTYRGSAAGGAAVYTFGEVAGAVEGKSPPILFCHGVGLGLAPYVPLVQRFAATGRPVIAVEFKHLAMRWTRRVPTIDEAAAALAAAVEALGARRVDAVGHSFGTFFLSRLLRTRPDLVRTVALLDPVVCCMWTGDLVSSFVYQPHASKRTGALTWTIARDLHAAVAVSRRFFWTDYELWPHELAAAGKRALLAVGGKDDLVPAAQVAATIARDPRVAMLHEPEAAHADVVFRPRWQARVVDEALAQMAAADCEEFFSSAAAEAVEVEAEVAVVAAAAAAAAIVRKASSIAARAPAARRASVPAVCADGVDELQQYQPRQLPIQRSYTIAAATPSSALPSPPSPSSPSWPSPSSASRRHRRDASSSSVGTAVAEDEDDDDVDVGPAPVFSEDEQEEQAERQRSARLARRRRPSGGGRMAAGPFATCHAQEAWAAGGGERPRQPPLERTATPACF